MDQPQVVYVRAEGNGLAVASLVLGIIGVVVGLVPILFFFAWVLGILALIFGGVGRKREFRRKMATWGAVLGLAAVLLGIWGQSIVNDAAEDLGDCLDAVSFDLRYNTNTSDRACD